MYYIIPVITLERFRAVTHTKAASFSIKKTWFSETNNIFYVKSARKNCTKPLVVFERIIKSSKNNKDNFVYVRSYRKRENKIV